MRRRLRVLVVAGVVLAVVACVPAVQARAKAPLVLAEGVGLVDVPRPFAAEVTTGETRVDGVTGDLYSPGPSAPVVLLVPGASPRGRDDPRVRRLADALARAGRAVFVPELSLYDRRLNPGDVERVVRATAALADRSGAPVVLLGISYGGSLALVGSADPRAGPHIALVATFGSYFDLVGVLQAATTGVSIVGDRRLPWPAHEQAAPILGEVAEQLVSPAHRPAVRAALAGGPRRELPAEARAAYELVTNADPERTPRLAARLGPTGRELLQAFSPATVAEEIDVPVLAVHSRDDPTVPYAELLRIRDGLPHARTVTVESFSHVDLDADGDLVALGRDLVAAWSAMGAVLAAQETWFD